MCLFAFFRTGVTYLTVTVRIELLYGSTDNRRGNFTIAKVDV